MATKSTSPLIPTPPASPIPSSGTLHRYRLKKLKDETASLSRQVARGKDVSFTSSDGYTLSAFGDVSFNDGEGLYRLPGPPSEIDPPKGKKVSAVSKRRYESGSSGRALLSTVMQREADTMKNGKTFDRPAAPPRKKKTSLVNPDGKGTGRATYKIADISVDLDQSFGTIVDTFRDKKTARRAAAADDETFSLKSQDSATMKLRSGTRLPPTINTARAQDLDVDRLPEIDDWDSRKLGHAPSLLDRELAPTPPLVVSPLKEKASPSPKKSTYCPARLPIPPEFLTPTKKGRTSRRC